MRYLGLDVHAETIAAAVAEPDGSVRELGTICNRLEAIRKLLSKLQPMEQREQLRVCATKPARRATHRASADSSRGSFEQVVEASLAVLHAVVRVERLYRNLA